MMSGKDLLLSIDCGTQPSRALVWDTKGQVLSEGRHELEILNPRQGWHEG